MALSNASPHHSLLNLTLARMGAKSNGVLQSSTPFSPRFHQQEELFEFADSRPLAPSVESLFTNRGENRLSTPAEHHQVDGEARVAALPQFLSFVEPFLRPRNLVC
jgi:hypothetical protein